MDSSAKLAKQLAVVALVLMLGFGAAYFGMKAALNHHNAPQLNQMKFWSVDEPPKPCEAC